MDNISKKISYVFLKFYKKKLFLRKTVKGLNTLKKETFLTDFCEVQPLHFHTNPSEIFCRICNGMLSPEYSQHISGFKTPTSMSLFTKALVFSPVNEFI